MRFLFVLIQLLALVGCTEFHPWLHDGWTMDGCKGDHYRKCDLWQPDVPGSTNIGLTGSPDAYRPALHECVVELRAAKTILPDEDAAEEKVMNCMRHKGWKYAGFISTP